MSYVDGFILAVPTANKDKFIAHARMGDSVFIEYGALRVLECWGDDVPDGKLTDFKGAVKAKPDEVVVFSWIEYPSKEVAEEAHRRVMNDPRMHDMDMPFDGQRMIVAGFTPILDEAGAKGGKKGDYTLLLIDGAVEQLPEGIAKRLSEDARVVTGLIDNGVSRLAIGRKSGGTIALLPLAELGIPRLAAFDKPKAWSF